MKLLLQHVTKQLSFPSFHRGLALDVSGARACRMRWTVRGIPRVPWNAEGVFDGISTFRLDNKGKIYEHQVCLVVHVARTEGKA
jgi:hypothetical protein